MSLGHNKELTTVKAARHVVLAAATPHFEMRNVIITGNEHHTGNAGNASFVVDESGAGLVVVRGMVLVRGMR